MVPKTLPPQAYLRECFIYDPETGILTWRVRPREHFRTSGAYASWNTRFAGKRAGSPWQEPSGYRCWRVCVDASFYEAHRLVWRMVTGCDPGPEIDHRDTDGMNNKWGNLREATSSQNKCNRGLNRSASPKGTYFHHGKWHARIKLRGKQYHLGAYLTAAEAHAAYCAAAARLHGEFANPGRSISLP